MSPGHVSAASIQPDTNEVKARLASLNAAAVLSGGGGGHLHLHHRAVLSQRPWGGLMCWAGSDGKSKASLHPDRGFFMCGVDEQAAGFVFVCGYACAGMLLCVYK